MLLLLPRPLLFWLLFACAQLARADVLGLPSDQRFPTAHYPFARVIEGCTAWRLPARFKSGFGQVDFSGACQAHDQCFHTLGRSWGDCNQSYLSALRTSCARDLKRQRLELGKLGEPDMQALHLCFDIADLFLARVQEPGAIKRFELAQRQQSAYLAHVRGTVQRLFISQLRRPATEAEEADALQRLADGVDLTAMRRALASAKADRRARLANIEPPNELPSIDEDSLAGITPAATPLIESTAVGGAKP